eukprot:scaffold19189_cov35-Cyclotella_meneghiniana.AAC.3
MVAAVWRTVTGWLSMEMAWARREWWMRSSMENASGNLDCLAWRSAASVAVVKSPGNSVVRRRWVLGGWEGEKFGFTYDVLGAAEEVATFCAHFPVELRAQIGEGRVTQGLKEKSGWYVM